MTKLLAMAIVDLNSWGHFAVWVSPKNEPSEDVNHKATTNVSWILSEKLP